MVLVNGGVFIKKYRNEWKYILNNQELSLLKSRISDVMNFDPHSFLNGKYFIHSLYFDDYKDSSFYGTISGLSKRFKWRIRYYGNDLSYIVLEKKEKLFGRCHKKCCLLSLDEVRCFISGNIFDIFYSTDKVLVREFIKDIMLYNYRPKVIIDYERIAYVEEIANVRVTFDMNISASYELDEFLSGNYSKFYINPSGVSVFEVKFDEILPSYIRNIVESYGFKQSSFSKYCSGRMLINSYIR